MALGGGSQFELSSSRWLTRDEARVKSPSEPPPECGLRGRSPRSKRTIGWPSVGTRARRACAGSLLVAYFHGGGMSYLLRGQTGEAHRLRPHLEPGHLVRGHQHVVEFGAALRMVAPEVGAAALGALEGAPRDEPGGRHLILEVQPVLPGEIVRGAAWHRGGGRPLADLLDLPERRLDARCLAYETYVVPHDLAQPVLER